MKKIAEEILEATPRHDTPLCDKCGGRTALMTGFWDHEPDREPYNNGVEDDSIPDGGYIWVGGYKCDKCGNVQGLWHE